MVGCGDKNIDPSATLITALGFCAAVVVDTFQLHWVADKNHQDYSTS